MLVDNLRRHLAALSYPRHALLHPEAHAQASRYVKEQFLALNYSVAADPISFEGQTFHNWIATLPEDRTDLPTLIVGAHFDSVPNSPGADDNASGVAVLLEAARLYREKRLHNKTPQTLAVQFVGFDLEECVTIGSLAFAQRLQREKKKIMGMLSLEMLGFTTRVRGAQRYPKGIAMFYPDVGDFLALVGSLKSWSLFWKLRRALKQVTGLKTHGLIVPGKGKLVEHIRRSDHAPFWDAGYPAVLVTDTSFFRNPHYHTPEDTIEKLDLSFMATVTEAITSFLVHPS